MNREIDTFIQYILKFLACCRPSLKQMLNTALPTVWRLLLFVLPSPQFETNVAGMPHSLKYFSCFFLRPSFGVNHDGVGNTCSRNGFMMASDGGYNSIDLTWSSCSRQQLLAFFRCPSPPTRLLAPAQLGPEAASCAQLHITHTAERADEPPHLFCSL